MKRDRKRRRNPGERNDSNPGEPTIPAGPGQRPRTLDPTRPRAFCARSDAAGGDVAAGSAAQSRQKSAGRKIRTAPQAGLSTQPGRPQNRKKEKRKKKKKKKKPASKPRGPRDSPPSRARRAILPKTRLSFANGDRQPRRKRPAAAGSSARRGASNKRGKDGKRVERTGKIAPACRAPRQRRCPARAHPADRERLATGNGKRKTGTGASRRAQPGPPGNTAKRKGE